MKQTTMGEKYDHSYETLEVAQSPLSEINEDSDSEESLILDVDGALRKTRKKEAKKIKLHPPNSSCFFKVVNVSKSTIPMAGWMAEERRVLLERKSKQEVTSRSA